MSGRLGELLVRENLISIQQLRKAQEEQQRNGTRIGSALIKTGAIEESRLTDFLSRQYGVPAINLKDFDIDPEIIKLVPKDVAEKHLVIPVNRAGPSLIVAMSDPSNIYAVDDLKFLTGYNIEPVVASEVSVREAIEKYYAERTQSLEEIVGEVSEEVELTHEEVEDLEDLAKQADEAPVVKLVNLVLLDAIKKHASDIHVEPYERDFRVRFRIDGVLYEVMRPPKQLKNAITSRLKIMAELDISERRLPQDGRIKIRVAGGKVMVTGPTGSGKTTTLYSALAALNQVSDNLSTAEDPVEFNFAGINQVQVHEDIGLNFAAALRSFLRQDPDTIMIGEIRDFETAEIGVKAALTGHLVLSTLHTNDAPGTVSRLLNMGIEPFLVTASLNLILAQRLARKLCPACKKPAKATEEQALLDAGVPPDKIGSFTVYEKAGCRECNDRGYRGRVAIYEVMPFWDGLKELVINGASAAELKQEAIRLGMQTLRMAALGKMMAGMTTLEEVVGNTAPDRF